MGSEERFVDLGEQIGEESCVTGADHSELDAIHSAGPHSSSKRNPKCTIEPSWTTGG
jgi:hypothetical protein